MNQNNKNQSTSTLTLIQKRDQIITDFREKVLSHFKNMTDYNQFDESNSESYSAFTLEIATPPDFFIPVIRTLLAFVNDETETDKFLNEYKWDLEDNDLIQIEGIDLDLIPYLPKKITLKDRCKDRDAINLAIKQILKNPEEAISESKKNKLENYIKTHKEAFEFFEWKKQTAMNINFILEIMKNTLACLDSLQKCPKSFTQNILEGVAKVMYSLNSKSVNKLKGKKGLKKSIIKIKTLKGKTIRHKSFLVVPKVGTTSIQLSPKASVNLSTTRDLSNKSMSNFERFPTRNGGKSTVRKIHQMPKSLGIFESIESIEVYDNLSQKPNSNDFNSKLLLRESEFTYDKQNIAGLKLPVIRHETTLNNFNRQLAKSSVDFSQLESNVEESLVKRTKIRGSLTSSSICSSNTRKVPKNYQWIKKYDDMTQTKNQEKRFDLPQMQYHIITSKCDSLNNPSRKSEKQFMLTKTYL